MTVDDADLIGRAIKSRETSARKSPEKRPLPLAVR